MTPDVSLSHPQPSVGTAQQIQNAPGTGRRSSSVCLKRFFRAWRQRALKVYEARAAAAIPHAERLQGLSYPSLPLDAAPDLPLDCNAAEVYGTHDGSGYFGDPELTNIEVPLVIANRMRAKAESLHLHYLHCQLLAWDVHHPGKAVCFLERAVV